MSAFETVLYEKKDHIAYVTLNRPQALNAYSVRMRDDLYQVLSAVKDDDEIRVAIVRGASDKAFCAGADLTEFLTAPSAIKARQIRFRRDLWRLFLSVPQPLIAAVHGYVLGSGMEIAASCDIRIASENAQFGLPEVGLGIIPGAGGTQTIPRLIGTSRSLEMLLTNRWISSAEAHTFGLVNRVVPNGQHVRAAEEIAQKIASFDPLAVREAKYAVTHGLDMSLEQGLELEKRLTLMRRRSVRTGV
ncbi:MAG TPA: enoyl-CoA hydratase-related protein [Syntrophorhabdaceae bacterium]|nr:enoyl-CoA hydratase-related protein [Syntrophorhabdaceae bacterium]